LHKALSGAIAAVLTFASAQAGLQVCNKAKVKTELAVGYIADGKWQSHGWWTLAPASCAMVVPGPLTARYYYLYGSDGGSGLWSGGMKFCTKPAATFAVIGRSRCAARGFETKGFFEIDTMDRKDWIQTLSD
jgi:uncharacterized membrane protein